MEYCDKTYPKFVMLRSLKNFQKRKKKIDKIHMDFEKLIN